MSVCMHASLVFELLWVISHTSYVLLRGSRQVDKMPADFCQIPMRRQAPTVAGQFDSRRFCTCAYVMQRSVLQCHNVMYCIVV